MKHQRRASEPFGILVLMRGKLCCCTKGFEIVAHRIEWRELHCATRRLHGRVPFSLERVDCAKIEPSERVAWVDVYSLAAALASGFQILQQVTIDKSFGGQCE